MCSVGSRADASRRAKVAMEMSAEQKFPFFPRPMQQSLNGWAQAAQDQGEDNLAEIKKGFGHLSKHRCAGLAALSSCPTGRDVWPIETGHMEHLPRLPRALTTAEEEHCWRAELNRIKGEMLLVVSSDNHAEAERCFLRALDVAQRQQAKSWELRCRYQPRYAMGNPRVRATGQAICSPQSTTGSPKASDTMDLKKAKALLEQLS